MWQDCSISTTKVQHIDGSRYAEGKTMVLSASSEALHEIRDPANPQDIQEGFSLQSEVLDSTHCKCLTYGDKPRSHVSRL